MVFSSLQSNSTLCLAEMTVAEALPTNYFDSSLCLLKRMRINLSTRDFRFSLIGMWKYKYVALNITTDQFAFTWREKWSCRPALFVSTVCSNIVQNRNKPNESRNKVLKMLAGRESKRYEIVDYFASNRVIHPWERTSSGALALKSTSKKSCFYSFIKFISFFKYGVSNLLVVLITYIRNVAEKQYTLQLGYDDNTETSNCRFSTAKGKC